MDRFFQWMWVRYGPRYSWAICALAYCSGLVAYLGYTWIVVAFERSDRYVTATVAMAAAMLVRIYLMVLPGSKNVRLIESWAAGHGPDSMQALSATYDYARTTRIRMLVTDVIWGALIAIIVGTIAGAPGWRLVQYVTVGATYGMAIGVMAMHSFVEGALRPARTAMAGDTGIGDSLPRSRPTFAAWSALSILAVGFSFGTGGAFVAPVLGPAREYPIVAVVIGVVFTLICGPLALMSVSPFMRPIRDLAEGTERVAAGYYSQRLPVVQDDDLGALAASFNRMQAGLAERQRLQAAFGTYVDPVLAGRLLEQGDYVFSAERREVTVMFVDVRDFTPFAEANTAEDTVARLNALFEIMVPAVVNAGGHINRFLGDGAMVVFGAPNDLAEHADAAVNAAVRIHRLVAAQFGAGLRIGIGINTGVVIAGTIGAGPHLEFSLIGDTTNVAARVEQLTKVTGDTILLTDQTVDAMVSRPPGLVYRGAHVLKGKSAPTAVFSVNPALPHSRLASTTTQTAVVDKPEEPEEDGHGHHHGHAH
ncbi:HAMP domain-containing protein [Mycolicibacterium elephantis]|uniref:adenylate/guanylate cyclase domain-containing protein n=1 Tax=Mycolicibacterium elephantis TaxID=81858 RepID=UPI0021F2FE2B|nr:adenylate/guanylate cyclase domain-containing protein [Mycolicibacterium elephantis]MCV7223742.1 HAMP domain-containing protein [Mycolicibacterium elephantis]